MSLISDKTVYDYYQSYLKRGGNLSQQEYVFFLRLFRSVCDGPFKGNLYRPSTFGGNPLNKFSWDDKKESVLYFTEEVAHYWKKQRWQEDPSHEVTRLIHSIWYAEDTPPVVFAQ